MCHYCSTRLYRDTHVLNIYRGHKNNGSRCDAHSRSGCNKQELGWTVTSNIVTPAGSLNFVLDKESNIRRWTVGLYANYSTQKAYKHIILECLAMRPRLWVVSLHQRENGKVALTEN